MIEIKNQVGEVIYRHDGDTLVGADLSDANLSHADLSYAMLYMAYLSGAILYMADLNGAKLKGAIGVKR